MYEYIWIPLVVLFFTFLAGVFFYGLLMGVLQARNYPKQNEYSELRHDIVRLESRMETIEALLRELQPRATWDVDELERPKR